MDFFNLHLEPFEHNLLYAAIALALVSLWFFFRERYTVAVGILFAGALFLRLMMAHIEPFIYWWDEQFHALVAKNMMQHLLTPTLIAHPVLPYDYTNWTDNHIWVHKQPLFLWQIALSFKLFGVNEFALRIPSAVMSALVVLLVYRIGKLSFSNKVGYLAAFLFAFSYLQINLVSGHIPTDHNDVAFMFYIMASIWAFMEYLRQPNWKWALLVGVLAGCAVLNKWLTGVLVFSGWGIYLLTDKEKRFTFGHYKHILGAAVACLLVFVPWQWHILSVFPTESRYEFMVSSWHFFKPIEGHEGDYWFHFDQLAFFFGKLAPYLVLPAIYIYYKKGLKPYNYLVLFYVVLIYLFFMLAATKMKLFCNIVSPLFYIFFACLLVEVVQFITGNRRVLTKIAVPVVVFVAGLITLDFYQLEMDHTPLTKNPFRGIRINNTNLIKQAVKEIPSTDYVVLNCRGYNSTLVMFYSGCTAYGHMGTEEQYQELKRKKIKMAVFVSPDLPDYYKNDPEVIKLNYDLFYFI